MSNGISKVSIVFDGGRKFLWTYLAALRPTALMTALVVLMAFSSGTALSASYVYDELGRLKSSNHNGETAEYVYDALGNLIQVKRLGQATLGITEFTPNAGPVATVVTINGSGFSPTIANNVVKFNMTTATVTAATTTKLTVTVPTGAATGFISVTVAGNVTTSTQSFTVTANAGVPTVSNATPACLNAGQTLTVTGTNFSTPANTTKLELGASILAPATISSTAISAVIPVGVGSGKVTVVTPGGTVTRSTYTLVPASIFSCADFLQIKTSAYPGSASFALTTASKYGALLFEGTQGTFPLLSVTGLTGTATSVPFRIYDPTNLQIGTGFTMPTASIVTLPMLPRTGTYLIVFEPGPYTASFNAALSLDTQLVNGATPLTRTTTASGQILRFRFNATLNDNVGIGMKFTNVSSGGNDDQFNFYIRRLDGGVIGFSGCYLTTAVGNCDVRTDRLPYTGLYELEIVSPVSVSALTVQVSLSSEIKDSLTIGTSKAVSIARSGQTAAYTFTGTVGQHLGLALSSSITNPVASAHEVTLYAPDQTYVLTAVLPHGEPTSTVDIPALTLAGTYTLRVKPQHGATGSVKMMVSQDAIYTVTEGAVPLPIALNKLGQTARLNFSATAGQTRGIGLRVTSITPAGNTVNAYLVGPDGVYIGNYASCDPTIYSGYCDLILINAPQTGQYTVLLVPTQTTTALAATASLSNEITGSITPNVTKPVSIARPGQTASYIFAGTAGQYFSVALFGPITSPADGYFSVNVVAPDGTVVSGTGTSHGSSPTEISLPALPLTGTYTIRVDPGSAATGSVNVMLSAAATYALTEGAPPLSAATTVSGQNIRATFSAAVGQNFGVGIDVTSYLPTTVSSGGISIRVHSPNGVYVAGEYCYFTSDMVCGLSVVNAPEAGVYTLEIDSPPDITSLSAQLSLSNRIAGTVVPGVPKTVTLSRYGQTAAYTFNGTAGMQLGLALESASTVPIDRQHTATIYAPDGNFVTAIALGHNQLPVMSDVPPLPATGVYSLLVSSDRGATGSVTVTLSQDSAYTLTEGAAPLAIATAMRGQSVRTNFNATAGQSIGLGLNITSITPSQPTTVGIGLTILSPSGTMVWSNYCYFPAPMVCGGAVYQPTETGTHTVLVSPLADVTAILGNLTLSNALAGSIAIGTPKTATFTRNGQVAEYTLNGVIGQRLRGALSSATTLPEDRWFTATLFAPDGTQVWAGQVNHNQPPSVTDIPTLLATGIYRLRIEPFNGSTGSVVVTLSDVAQYALVSGAAPQNFAITLLGQAARLTFGASVGQNFGVGLKMATLQPDPAQAIELTLFAPDESNIGYAVCYLTNPDGNCALQLLNAPLSGTYAVKVHSAAVTTAIAGTAVLSLEQSGTITLGAAKSIAITRVGQTAAYTFSGTAGQTLTLTSSSFDAVPNAYNVTFSILNPDGTELGTAWVAAPNAISHIFPILPATGTYTLRVNPQVVSSLTATITLSVQ